MERKTHLTSEQAPGPINTRELFERVKSKLAQVRFEDPYLEGYDAIRLATEQDPILSAIASQDLDLYVAVADKAVKSLEGWVSN